MTKTKPGSKPKRKKASKGKVHKTKTKVGQGTVGKRSTTGEPEEPAPSTKNEGTFQVEFQFFDPEEEDFHSVRDLLCSGTLGFAELDFSGLANSIVDQVNIGTMVKSGNPDEARSGVDQEDEDVTLCGMLTILNLQQFANTTWCKSLATLLESKAKSEKQLLQYTRCSGQDQVGLILSERFVNLPLEVIPAMHSAILEDIKWSCTTEYCPPEERPFYFFTHFLCLARCQAVTEDQGPLQSLQLKNGTLLQFSRAEELVLARAASFVSSFPQQSKDGRKASSFGKKRKVEGDVKGQAYEGAVKNMREALKEA
ncbi:unnamed protein product [Durusdinium trenchii]|uniref:Protein BCCIP homolog n=1 Tax=Durusdinium trenchii TaxID=1381693 RepID=A0ABP0IKD7_9DINO